MWIGVVTLFPEFFPGPLGTGLLGKALADGVAKLELLDPRSLTQDRHHTVDDAPYGGGAGMVMKPESVVGAIEQLKSQHPEARVVLLSPQGAPLRQRELARFARCPSLILVAGRYEGFDERVRHSVDEEVSLGDFVLTGGEYAALALIDGVVRLLPGTLGNQASTEGDSFSSGLLEHAQYTRPPSFRSLDVPPLLLSGDHRRIAEARLLDALARTRARRPELLAERGFSKEELALLRTTVSLLPPIAVVAALPEDPALSPAFLDEVARVVDVYDLAAVVLAASLELAPLASERLSALLAHSPAPDPFPPKSSRRTRLRWAQEGSRRLRRRQCLGRLEVVAGPDEAAKRARERWPGALVAVPLVHDDERSEAAVGPSQLRREILGSQRPLLLSFLSPLDLVPDCRLAPVRASAGLGAALGTVGALVVQLDRLVGEA